MDTLAESRQANIFIPLLLLLQFTIKCLSQTITLPHRSIEMYFQNIYVHRIFNQLTECLP